eukprot:scaffold32350_cov60-Phaeocystis_antarctica.AAC.4
MRSSSCVRLPAGVGVQPGLTTWTWGCSWTTHGTAVGRMPPRRHSKYGHSQYSYGHSKYIAIMRLPEASVSKYAKASFMSFMKACCILPKHSK